MLRQDINININGHDNTAGAVDSAERNMARLRRFMQEGMSFQDAAQRIANDQNPSRIRPGEDIEAAHHRATLEADRRRTRLDEERRRRDEDNAALNRRQQFARTRSQEEVVGQAEARASMEAQRRDAANADLNRRLNQQRVRPTDEEGYARHLRE